MISYKEAAGYVALFASAQADLITPELGRLYWAFVSSSVNYSWAFVTEGKSMDFSWREVNEQACRKGN